MPKRHAEKPYLTKSLSGRGQPLGTEKDREWYCTVCYSRVTESLDGNLEYGHVSGCYHWPSTFPKSGKQLTPEDWGHICEECGRGDFETDLELVTHLDWTHDKSLSRECDVCETEFPVSLDDAEKQVCSRKCRYDSLRERAKSKTDSEAEA